MADYLDPEDDAALTTEDLRESAPEVQRRVMRAWFRARYEDPAERTPYESAEGGYQWIWGGPFDAGEELEGEFSGTVPDSVIEELVDELNGESWQWAPTPSREDYDDYLVDDIAQISTYYHTFQGAILDIEALLRTAIPEPVSLCYWRLLYVNVITALETYLSDAFINTVVNQPTLLRKFIETTPEFQTEKVSFADVYKAMEESQRKARAHLSDVVWHHLARVKPMYRDTLGISFPNDIGLLFRAILTRHDVVHRNGKTKDGKELVITAEDVRTLIEAVEAFAMAIDEALAQHRSTSAENSSAGDASAF